METNVNYTAVGAFVIFLLTCIILAIIWLSSGFRHFNTTVYKVNMDEPVSGINMDSSVEFNGVNVGKVKDIIICKKDPRLVELYLRIKSDTPITKGTRAIISMRGLTGISYISLQDKGEDLTPLVAEHGETYPIILASKSFYVRLDEMLNQLSSSVSTINKSISALLDEQNLRAFKVTLGNMQRFSTTLSNNSVQFDQILHNAARASAVLERQTLPYASQAMSNLSDVSSEIKQNPSILIRGKSSPALGPGER